MINEIIYMNGYGLYVWSAFIFTLLSFASLYVITKIQFMKEQRKFIKKLVWIIGILFIIGIGIVPALLTIADILT